MVRKVGFSLAFLVTASCFTVWWIDRPRQIMQRFVGHVSNERYDEAAQMLADPSTITRAVDGGLVIADHSGATMHVPKERLPFLAGGGKPTGQSFFSMTALQGSVNGNIPPPVVTIYLSVQGGKVKIDDVSNRSEAFAVPLEGSTAGEAMLTKEIPAADRQR